MRLTNLYSLLLKKTLRRVHSPEYFSILQKRSLRPDFPPCFAPRSVDRPSHHVCPFDPPAIPTRLPPSLAYAAPLSPPSIPVAPQSPPPFSQRSLIFTSSSSASPSPHSPSRLPVHPNRAASPLSFLLRAPSPPTSSLATRTNGRLLR